MICNLRGRNVEMILVNNSCRLSCSHARLMSLRGKLEAMSKLRIVFVLLLLLELVICKHEECKSSCVE